MIKESWEVNLTLAFSPRTDSIDTLPRSLAGKVRAFGVGVRVHDDLTAVACCD